MPLRQREPAAIVPILEEELIEPVSSWRREVSAMRRAWAPLMEGLNHSGRMRRTSTLRSECATPGGFFIDHSTLASWAYHGDDLSQATAR